MKCTLIVGLIAGALLTPAVAAAEDPDLEIYGTLVPFLEYVSTSGATKAGHTGGADQVPATAYTGPAHNRPRLRMVANTSNIGFRGGLPIVDRHLKLIWQIENAVPIDGNGPPNTFASRNSHIGFAGDWGSLIFGIWETPYKYALATAVGPLKAGYVADYTPIISTPGFASPALNTASGFSAGSPSNAAFHRREANSIQYWSPNVAGFTARLHYTINEDRNSGGPAAPGTNPWLFSGMLGWEGFGLRVRYAYDLHHDYFGMGSLGGSPQPSQTVTSSNDMGHVGLISYRFELNPDFATRLVGVGEFLKYKSNDRTTSAIDGYSRPAFYGLLEQSIFRNHVWLAYGQALPGACTRVGGGACSTKDLGAKYATLGYLFAFTETTNVHLIAYRIFNDASARYETFPPLSPIAPGADQMGVGLGILHSFSVGILGEKAPEKGK
jgi:predicted porin